MILLFVDYRKDHVSVSLMYRKLVFSNCIWVILNLHEEQINSVTTTNKPLLGTVLPAWPRLRRSGTELRAPRPVLGSKDTTHQDLMRSSFSFLIKNTTFKMPHSFFVFIESKHRNFS